MVPLSPSAHAWHGRVEGVDEQENKAGTAGQVALETSWLLYYLTSPLSVLIEQEHGRHGNPFPEFQISIPKAVRTERGWQAGQEFAFVPKGAGVLLVPVPKIEAKLVFPPLKPLMFEAKEYVPSNCDLNPVGIECLGYRTKSVDDTDDIFMSTLKARKEASELTFMGVSPLATTIILLATTLLACAIITYWRGRRAH